MAVKIAATMKTRYDGILKYANAATAAAKIIKLIQKNCGRDKSSPSFFLAADASTSTAFAGRPSVPFLRL